MQTCFESTCFTFSPLAASKESDEKAITRPMMLRRVKVICKVLLRLGYRDRHEDRKGRHRSASAVSNHPGTPSRYAFRRCAQSYFGAVSQACVVRSSLSKLCRPLIFPGI